MVPSVLDDVSRARAALQYISADIGHDERFPLAAAMHEAGLDFDDFDGWYQGRPTYTLAESRLMWKSCQDKPGGYTRATLFKVARENGFKDNTPFNPSAPRPAPAPRPPAPPVVIAPGMSAAEIWARCEDATMNQPYAALKKAPVQALEGLRVLPDGDPLVIAGERMAGALVVPVYRPDGSLATLQFIALPEVAARLKAKKRSGKLNLPKHEVEGSFTVGEIVPGGLIYVVEGIGAAWACWQASSATGAAAVVTFGAGRTLKVAKLLRQSDPAAKLVICPDVGKEAAAAKVALEVGAAVVNMPDGFENNDDVADLAARYGGDVLADLLDTASFPATHNSDSSTMNDYAANDNAMPSFEGLEGQNLAPLKLVPVEKPSRYKLLGSSDLRSLPPLAWRVRGVLPATGLAGIYGPSASGKSFLALDMAAAIAEGREWFGNRVEAAPVVYCALEGEGGIRNRVAALEAHLGRDLPDNLHIVLQPFKLTEPIEVAELAAVIPSGAVVFLDTLNRAAPTADENSSSDMGVILEATKRLQSRINGLVVLVHHTGKDATKGLRGHSSLFAALDAAVEVSRNGDRRDWKVAKSKDGEDGGAHPFTLRQETLGTDDYGDPITSCVVARDTAAQDMQRAKVPQGARQKLAFDALAPLFKDGETGKPGAPLMRPCVRLEAAVAAVAIKLPVSSDKRTTAAKTVIAALVERGVLGVNDGWLWLA